MQFSALSYFLTKIFEEVSEVLVGKLAKQNHKEKSLQWVVCGMAHFTLPQWAILGLLLYFSVCVRVCVHAHAHMHALE